MTRAPTPVCDVDQIADRFRSELAERSIAPSYAEQMGPCLDSFLAGSWKRVVEHVQRDHARLRAFADGVSHVVVYWPSVFREKGILRASCICRDNDRVVPGRRARPEMRSLEKLITLDPENPRHLLSWVTSHASYTSCELVLRHGSCAVPERLINSATHFTIRGRAVSTATIGRLGDLWRSLANPSSIVEELLTRVGDSIGDYTEITRQFHIPGVKRANKVLVLAHPVESASAVRFPCSRVVYVPLLQKSSPHVPPACTGAVIGLRQGVQVSIAAEDLEMLKGLLLSEFLYPARFAESHAVAIVCPDPSSDRYPESAFAISDGRGKTGAHSGGLRYDGTEYDFHVLLDYASRLSCDRCCAGLFRSLSKALREASDKGRNLGTWDYAEELFWALFDAVPRELRLNKNRSDFLKSRQRVLKDLREGPIPLLCRALDNELPLQELAGYREHFIHSFHVFLLGVLAWDKLGCVGGAAKASAQQAWMIAAFFHDIGYALEKLDKLANDYLGKLVGEGAAGRSARDDYVLTVEMNPSWGYILAPSRFLSALDGVVSAIEPKKKMKLRVRSLLQYAVLKCADHGVISAMLLCHALNRSSKLITEWASKPRNAKIIREALGAIAFHNIAAWDCRTDGKITFGFEDADLKTILDLDEHPLRRLLICCDELACMGRNDTEKYHKVKMAELSFSNLGADARYDEVPWVDVDDHRSRMRCIRKLTRVTVTLQKND